MDASATPQVDADFSNVYGFFFNIANTDFPQSRQKSTVIKYTKLPDFDFDSKGSWPSQSYTLHPRLRRIVSVGDPTFTTSRSLRADVMEASKTMTSNITKRKIVTITEDDENDFYPRLSAGKSRSPSVKTSNRSVGPDFKDGRQITHRTTSRLTTASKYSRDIKNNVKANSTNNTIKENNKKDVHVTKPNVKSKYLNYRQTQQDNTKVRTAKEKETVWNPRSANASSKVSLSKNLVTPSESEKEINVIKNKLYDNIKPVDILPKKQAQRIRTPKSPSSQANTERILKKNKIKNKPITVIHVPLDEKYHKQYHLNSLISSENVMLPSTECFSKVDSGTEMDKNVLYNKVNIGTDPLRKQTVDQVTEIDPQELRTTHEVIESTDFETEVIKEIFDSLQIPNVTLTKDKSDSKEDIVKIDCSNSCTNINAPSEATLNKEAMKNDHDSRVCKSSSYIISRATVTCTTRQKINFHVVESNDSSKNIKPNSLSYPINVMSIFKKEMRNAALKNLLSDDTCNKKDNSDAERTNRLNELKSFNCSYVFNSNKLMKPSDIISTIRVNNGLLHSDYICEQFQRELNFIDSFFESLQYLENCSLSDKCFSKNKIQTWSRGNTYEADSPDYSSFLSKLENGSHIDDTETMASKSLCLLNLLIRDEQRRAKNLLFVLKMREDALKDFTKSQILWLEDKKKQDNTDISTLKKKQRGALLKLQHECGEMQRMRKTLLTLTEKRKVALMKTKKNLELKLSNSLNVDQIILGKKKLKKGNISDRNTAPLKCFDLSSSGCDDSSTSRAKSDMPIPAPGPLQTTPVPQVTSAEKSIQTGDSIIGTVLVDEATGTAAENFVAVDGGYLNILFHNLSLPQIFSYGKQYEVNEEALKNIVNSTTTQHQNLHETDVVEKFIDQIKNPDLESSTPSTARSLVEEMDQYYKGLTEGDKTSGDSTDRDIKSSEVRTVNDKFVQVDNYYIDENESRCFHNTSTMTPDSTENFMSNINNNDNAFVCNMPVSPVETEPINRKEPVLESQAGPLPVPVGAAAVIDTIPSDVPIWLLPNTSVSSVLTDTTSINSQPVPSNAQSKSSLASPVHCEAEELRRQQLAIEREIKALEQQQCQLLVVREIPDKPPPPYTPPTESRISKIPRMFIVDEIIEERVHKYITNPLCDPSDPTDAFDVFLNDFCTEAIERQRLERSDKPWDACNLLPQKQQVDSEKFLKKTSCDLNEVLSGVVPNVVSGVSTRRADHIDDILFAEWRRCEPEWTALHTDEAIVKNQLFDSIFQKILTETIDEYKRIVRCTT